MYKRIIALLLAFLMVINTVPTPARAANDADVNMTVSGNEAENSIASKSPLTLANEETGNTGCEKCHSVDGVHYATCPYYVCPQCGIGPWHETCSVVEETHPMLNKLVKLNAAETIKAYTDPSNVSSYIYTGSYAFPKVMVITHVYTTDTQTYYKLASPNGTWPSNSNLSDDTYYLESSLLEVIDEKDYCVCGCEACSQAEDCECACQNCKFCEPAIPEEPEYPKLSHQETGVEVTAESLPEGVILEVSEAKNADTLLDEFKIPVSKKVFGLDISICYTDNSEYQPDGALVKIPVNAAEGTLIGIVHNHDGEITFMGVTEVLSDGTVEFYTDNFSEFAGFTVDFHYNGVDFSIEGLSSILLSELFEAMGIEEDATKAETVVFSDNNLVTTERQDDGDWLLTSLASFETHETLIITFSDNHAIVIDVTDPTLETADLWGTIAKLSYYKTDNDYSWNTNKRTMTFRLYNSTTPGSKNEYVNSTEVKRIHKSYKDYGAILSIPVANRGNYWFYGTSSGCTLSLTDDLHMFKISPEMSDGSSVVIERIDRTIMSGGAAGVYQKRYAAISGYTESRIVKIIVNGDENHPNSDTQSKIFPNRSGYADDQLDVQYIDYTKYFYGSADLKKEPTKVIDPEGKKFHYAADSTATYYSYSNGVYTIPLKTRYYVVFNKNGATSTTNMDDQAFIWSENKKALSTNTYKKEYTVTYSTDKGSVITDEANTKASATFLGWAESATGEVKYDDEEPVQNLSGTPGGKINLFAQWGPISSVTLPKPNDVNGYTFKGWYTDAACSDANKVTGTTYTPSSNVTLYAKWEANDYKLTFDYNGGTGNSTTQYEVTYGSSNYCDVHWLNPIKKDYIFDGWYTASTGGTQVYYGKTDNLADTTKKNGYCISGAYWNSSNQWIGTSDLTLYAHWIPIYKVTLDDEDATTAGTTAYWYIHNTVLNGVYYYTNEDCTTALANYTITPPTKTGYIFGGYYTGADGTGTRYVDENGVCINNRYQVAGDVTLYAKWTPITYTVTYNGNSTYYGTTADSTHTYDVEKNLTANGYERSGYKFVGWNTKADGSGKDYADKATVENLTSTNGATVTLYAQWKPIYKITLDSQKQTTEAENFYFVHMLDAYYSDSTCNTALADNKIVPPSKDGYVFKGYYTEKDGKGTQYIDMNGKINSTCCQLSADTTLYANWERSDYTITYRYNDGVTQDSEVAYHYETDVVLTVPERVGYIFQGWTNLSQGEITNNWKYTNYDYDYQTGEMENPGMNQYGDVILEARWTPITYQIQFVGGEGTTGSVDPITAAYDAEETLRDNKFDRIVTVTYDVNGGKNLNPNETEVSLNAIFKGWRLNEETFYDENASVKNLASVQDAVVLLQADWEYQSTAAPSVERDGYTFLGWKPEGSAADLYWAGANITPSQNVKLIAQWQAENYTITYDPNGGSVVEPTAYTSDKAFVLADAPTKEGYKFTGWKLKNSLLESEGNWADSLYTAKQPIEAGKFGNIELIAQWKEQYRYALKFDANGGDNPPANLTKDWCDDESHTFVWTTVPTREGYTFLGWGESADSQNNVTGDAYDRYFITGAKTTTVEKILYAIWKRQTGSLFLDYTGDGAPVIVTITCTQAAESSELITIQTVIDKDATITNLPTGTYSVTVEPGRGNYTASFAPDQVSITAGGTSEVDVTITAKSSNWLTGFARMINRCKEGGILNGK